MTEGRAFVFDSGPLSHFAQSGWLGVLAYQSKGSGAFIPEAVEQELSDGTHEFPHLRLALECDWLVVDRSDDIHYTVYTAGYEARLVGADGRNRGECAVLAMARAFDRIAVIDDAEARTIAEEDGIAHTTTLHLLCDAIRERMINARTARQVVSDLLQTTYFLPFEDAEEFYGWAVRNGLLDLEHVQQ